MPDFDVIVRGPDGQPQRRAFSGANSPDELIQHLRAQGLEPLGYKARQAAPVPSSTTTTPTTTGPPQQTPVTGSGQSSPTPPTPQAPEERFSLPILGTPSDVAQLGGAAVGTLAARHLPLIGRAAPLIGGLLAREGVGQLTRPSGMTPAARAGQEGVRGVVNELGGRVAQKVARPIKALGELLPGRASKFLKPLGELVPSLGTGQAQKVLSPRAEAAAGAVTQASGGMIRRMFGSILKNELKGAETMRGSARTLVRSIAAGPDRATALQKAFDDTGIKFDEITTAKLQTLGKAQPAKLLQGLKTLVNHGGNQDAADRVRKALVHSRLSQAFRDSLVAPPRKAFNYPGAVQGRVIDPDLLRTSIASFRKQLGTNGEKLAFGEAGLAELDKLSRTLAANPLARDVAQAAAGKVPSKSLGRQARELLTTRPYARAMALAIAARTHIPYTGAILAEEGVANMLGHLAGTPAGLRWIASGLEMQNQGLPEKLIVESLGRQFPAALESLGLGDRTTAAALGTISAYEAGKSMLPGMHRGRAPMFGEEPYNVP